jgi:hypothetical protein
MKMQLQISGTYNLNNKTDSFAGTITFDEKESSIYYNWYLNDKDGQPIASKSVNVMFQEIPAGHDKFEFLRRHAIEGIKKYRIGRNMIIQELNVS